MTEMPKVRNLNHEEKLERNRSQESERNVMREVGEKDF